MGYFFNSYVKLPESISLDYQRVTIREFSLNLLGNKLLALITVFLVVLLEPNHIGRLIVFANSFLYLVINNKSHVSHS